MIPEQPPAEIKQRTAWPMAKRIAFRFAFVFWILFDNGLGLVLWVWPWLDRHVSTWLDWPVERLTLWTGVYVFRLTGEASVRHPTGSGDTALGWIGVLCAVVVSLAVCAVWSAVSEPRGRRREYNTLYAWLRLVMRFALAATLFSYGFEKVFPLQMPPPSATTLAETYGASSPMKLAWTFLGASWQYRIFAGLSEVIPGVLLCFRRTSTLGAMGAAAVMLNIFMMNIGYDIPVKLYSLELLLMALFLLLPDALPLWRFFVARKDAALTGVWVRKPERQHLRIAAHCLQVLVIGHLLFITGVSSWKAWRGGETELKGQWTVQSPSGAATDLHWTVMTVRAADFVQVKTADQDKPQFLTVTTSPKTKTMEFVQSSDNGEPQGAPYATLHWTDAGPGKLQLAGTWKGRPAAFTLEKINVPPTLLMSRGFHWVQEYPMNR